MIGDVFTKPLDVCAWTSVDNWRSEKGIVQVTCVTSWWLTKTSMETWEVVIEVPCVKYLKRYAWDPLSTIDALIGYTDLHLSFPTVSAEFHCSAPLSVAWLTQQFVQGYTHIRPKLSLFSMRKNTEHFSPWVKVPCRMEFDSAKDDEKTNLSLCALLLFFIWIKFPLHK